MSSTSSPPAVRPSIRALASPGLCDAHVAAHHHGIAVRAVLRVQHVLEGEADLPRDLLVELRGDDAPDVIGFEDSGHCALQGSDLSIAKAKAWLSTGGLADSDKPSGSRSSRAGVSSTASVSPAIQSRWARDGLLQLGRGAEADADAVRVVEVLRPCAPSGCGGRPRGPAPRLPARASGAVSRATSSSRSPWRRRALLLDQPHLDLLGGEIGRAVRELDGDLARPLRARPRARRRPPRPGPSSPPASACRSAGRSWGRSA